jgi:hypothetical protein
MYLKKNYDISEHRSNLCGMIDGEHITKPKLCRPAIPLVSGSYDRKMNFSVSRSEESTSNV